MEVVLVILCLFTILGLSDETVFVEDRLYPDYEQRRIDIEDRLHFADVPSGKREVSSSPIVEEPFGDVFDYDEIPADTPFEATMFYDTFDDNSKQNYRRTRQKVESEKSKMARLRDKLFSKRKHKNKYTNYKANVKGLPSAKWFEEKNENLSKHRHSDVVPGLNEISV